MIEIAGRRLAADEPPYVIAEIGVNHDGDPGRAHTLIDLAARTGADAVKFQMFRTDDLMSSAARLAAYQREAGEADPHAMLRRLELDFEAGPSLIERAHAAGVHAIVTIFSVEHVDEIAAQGWDAFKTASPDVVHHPLLRTLMTTGRPLLVSTGAATLDEVGAAATVLGSHPHLFLHCVSAYPTADEDATLDGRLAMLDVTPRALGYSDHTTAVDTGAFAVAGGAALLEKHVTDDAARAGPDHGASLEEAAFAEYVRLARRAWRARGRREKVVTPVEDDVRAASRQSIVARHAIAAGAVIDPEDITFKRPGGGTPPCDLDQVVGRRAARAIEADALIQREDLA